jgi:hypothetical protein
MTELFYWKEMERRARAAQALAMLYNRMDSECAGRPARSRGCKSLTVKE